MAGIYIHIPFCKKKCFYCDFYSTANLKLREDFTDALCKEISLRKDYVSEEIRTIYFGGGTPSLLTDNDFDKINNALKLHFDLSHCEEKTIEVNPDDITTEYAQMLLQKGFNRISVGIQSFNDEELQNINRRHSSAQAFNAIETLQKCGLGNISIDLIFGLPKQTLPSWEKNLQKAVSLNVQHISCYSLSYEENTVLWQKLKRKEILPTDENLSEEMFKTLTNTLTRNGFEHYEISNFAQKGFRSIHNASYWNGTPYFGFGPAAHSYNGFSRQWNIRNTKKYIQSISDENPFYEVEQLSDEERYNDFIITGLRTCEGIETLRIKELFGEKLYHYCMHNAQNWINDGKMQLKGNMLRLANDGIFISDTIFSDLIYVE